MTVILFLTQTIIAIFQRESELLEFWSWIAAGQTAAWRLKWPSIPILIVTVWLGGKLYRSIKFQPKRFCGLKQAQAGLIASLTVVFLIALLIGVTVPERLRRRELAKEAAVRAQWYTIERAALEYQIRYQTFPADLNDLQKRISDRDGTLAEAIRNLDPNGYRPSADFAAVGKEKSPSLRGAAIRKASLSSATDDTAPGGLAFTTFELQLPGEDKILNTEDDWIGQNGILRRITEVAKGGVGRSVSAGVPQP